MKRIEDMCCDCTSVGLPCMGPTCPRKNCVVYVCDKCGDETDLYHYDEQELCISCIERLLDKVEE